MDMKLKQGGMKDLKGKNLFKTSRIHQNGVYTENIFWSQTVFAIILQYFNDHNSKTVIQYGSTS